VDLAVGRGDLPGGVDQQRGVRQQVTILDALGDAAGDEMDAELTRPRAGGGDRRAVERLGELAQLLGGAEQAPLLGEHHELGAVGGGGADDAFGGIAVRAEVGGRVQLDNGGSHPPPLGLGNPPGCDGETD
jgi:hypothetical protein